MKLRHEAESYRPYISTRARGHNEAGPMETNGYGWDGIIYWYLGGEKVLHQEKPK